MNSSVDNTRFFKALKKSQQKTNQASKQANKQTASGGIFVKAGQAHLLELAEVRRALQEATVGEGATLGLRRSWFGSSGDLWCVVALRNKRVFVFYFFFIFPRLL